MNKKLVRSLFFLAMLAAPVLADGEIDSAQPVTQSDSVAQESVPEQASVAPDAAPAAAPEVASEAAPAAAPEVAPAAAPETVAKPTEPASTEASMSQSASIFVQDPAIFHQRTAELEKLKKSVEGKNEGLDSLLAEASHFAKMNDQCATISINDVMGDECWTFYRVELPAFEERYMRVTGEVRLGHMETARGLEDRKLQIDACVDALYSFAQSKDQFLNLEGGVFLEPLSSGFQANYDFTLQYEPNHRKHAFEIAQKWGETCREMVVRSAYYLNGVKLFHSRISAGPVGESPVRIRFEDKKVSVDGEAVVMKRGKQQKFKGSVEYPQKTASLNGRWIWENQGNNDGVDFGPEEDEAVLDSIYAAELASKTAEAGYGRFGVRETAVI